ncbi:MAG: alanyl-tRNA editing protein [Alphaproteobacteria bacterium]
MTHVNAQSGIMLDRTVFYPAGGGQPGDSGALRLRDGRIVPIATTVKGDGAENIIHVPAEGAPLPAEGDAVIAAIDWERRYRHMRVHSALHLLCALVPYGVTGGRVATDKGSLDFDSGDSALDKDALTEALNRLVVEDHPILARWIGDEQLAAQPELVRTMSVAPPAGTGHVRLLEIVGVDLQPCGGTHVRRTGEIGPLAVAKIESKGKRNRRITVALQN